jgi:hypothetical protein
MSIRRLRTLGVLAATSAIAVAALGAPAGASATIGTGKVDVAVDTVGLDRPTKQREVRDVNAVVTAVGVGRLISQVKVDLSDTKFDLKGPCGPIPSVTFYDKAGTQYAGNDVAGNNWFSASAGLCQKVFAPRIGAPVNIPVLTLPFPSVITDQTVAPSAYPGNLVPLLAKPGKVCATVTTAPNNTFLHISRPVCAPIL